MERKAIDIHGQAEHSREAGDFLEALKLTDEALLKYQEEGDIFGVGDVLASRTITFRLLFEKTDDKLFLILAKHAGLASVEIAEMSNDEGNLSMPLYRLGQVQEDLGELTESIASYRKAIKLFESNPPKEHNRNAVLTEMKIRSAVCEYKNGDSAAIEKAESLLSELESNVDEVKYNKDVWVSGGHMRIADALKKSEPEKSKSHLKKAKEIIDANPDLKLRKIQWEKLSSSINDSK